MNADAAEKKQSELDKVAQILGINIFEKSRKLSSESKDSSENARIQEKTSDLVKVNSESWGHSLYERKGIFLPSMSK